MSKEGVKIVIINTEYIQTDASSFKSVVQKFTGKNSSSPAPAKVTPAAYRRGYDHGDDNKLLKDLSPLDELLGLYANEVVRDR
ncbi:VQ motif-containing protein 10-like [Solanum tuberosum]|uniref:VQ motif-containing protein 10-like n=1 Tax=Solanum tuberosum TaxID=4113 RepID=UPI0003D2653F|nr:PREDICTED: VQ motif-containing protein 10-like [Solanum tuberosum]